MFLGLVDKPYLTSIPQQVQKSGFNKGCLALQTFILKTRLLTSRKIKVLQLAS